MMIYIKGELEKDSFLNQEFKIDFCDALAVVIDQKMTAIKLAKEWKKYGWDLQFTSNHTENDLHSFVDLTFFPIHRKISEFFDEKPFKEFQTTHFFWRNQLIAKVQFDQGGKTNRVDMADDDLVSLNSTDVVTLLPKLRTVERSFNRIRIGEDFVEKQTTDIAKGEAEFDFLKNVPEDIQDFFPAVFDSDKDESSFTYTLRRINLIDLSRYYLLEAFDEDMVLTILSKIGSYFDRCPQQIAPNTRWQKKMESLIVEKLVERVRIFEQTDIWPALNQKLPASERVDLQALVDRIKKAFFRLTADASGTLLVWSHGDLCFSNILCNREGQICFIDPRGAPSFEEGYLPIYYDLAKLSQCFMGNYDGLLAGKSFYFEAEKRIFLSWLRQQKVSIPLVRLCEASLFVSLLPLHLDNQDKLHFFVRAGLSALEAAESEVS